MWCFLPEFQNRKMLSDGFIFVAVWSWKSTFHSIKQLKKLFEWSGWPLAELNNWKKCITHFFLSAVFGLHIPLCSGYSKEIHFHTHGLRQLALGRVQQQISCCSSLKEAFWISLIEVWIYVWVPNFDFHLPVSSGFWGSALLARGLHTL